MYISVGKEGESVPVTYQICCNEILIIHDSFIFLKCIAACSLMMQNRQIQNETLKKCSAEKRNELTEIVD